MTFGVFRAVLFDFGGVMTDSPFDRFARYEVEHGLPTGFLRRVNATNPNDNAWAQIERRDIDADRFDSLFADESAALGHRVPGAQVLALLNGSLRPEMVELLDQVVESGYVTACLTNNVIDHDMGTESNPVMGRFDFVIESSKVGYRKPETRFYEIACETIGVTPIDCVFLDDLGINLKPARAMGMTTIKVTSASQAISDLSMILGW